MTGGEPSRAGRARLVVRRELRERLRAARARPEATLAWLATAVAVASSAAFMLLPLYWLFSAALRPRGGLSVPPELVPPEVTFSNLRVVLLDTAFPLYLGNSLLVSGATVLLTVAVATPAGYALSRFELRHERAFVTAILAVQMLPLIALVTPMYRLFAIVGLLDTLAVQVLANAVLAIPVGVWLLQRYFDTLSPHLEEAARVGGATRFRAFLVVLPLARPAVAATGIFAFVTSWNQFLVPLAFTSSREHWTVPLGLYEFVGRRAAVDWPLLGAACLWALVPVFVIVVAFDRHLVAGLGGGFRGGGRG